MSLGERIFQVRRADCRDSLVERGLSIDLAEHWCDAWEAHAELQGRERLGDFWETGRHWIDAQIAARKSPHIGVR